MEFACVQADEDEALLDEIEVLEFEVPVIVVPASLAAELPGELVVEQRIYPSRTPGTLLPETPEPAMGSGWDQADQQEARLHGRAPKDKGIQTFWDESQPAAAQQLPVASRIPASAQAVREAAAASSPTQETAGACSHSCPTFLSVQK